MRDSRDSDSDSEYTPRQDDEENSEESCLNVAQPARLTRSSSTSRLAGPPLPSPSTPGSGRVKRKLATTSLVDGLYKALDQLRKSQRKPPKGVHASVLTGVNVENQPFWAIQLASRVHAFADQQRQTEAGPGRPPSLYTPDMCFIEIKQIVMSHGAPSTDVVLDTTMEADIAECITDIVKIAREFHGPTPAQPSPKKAKVVGRQTLSAGAAKQSRSRAQKLLPELQATVTELHEQHQAMKTLVDALSLQVSPDQTAQGAADEIPEAWQAWAEAETLDDREGSPHDEALADKTADVPDAGQALADKRAKRKAQKDRKRQLVLQVGSPSQQQL